MKTDPQQRIYFSCACDSMKHIFRVDYDPEDNEVIMSFYLNAHLSLFERIKTALRFILFPTNISRFGDYDCVILSNKNDCERLANVLRRVE